MNTDVASSTTTLFDSANRSNDVTISFDPLAPCPRLTWELIVGATSGVLIVISNVVCMLLLNGNKTSQHSENRYYILNLGVSNIFCGTALLAINSVELVSSAAASEFSLETCYNICLVLGPIYIFSIMSPYVALATLGLDIANYCHLSIDYRRRMSRRKMFMLISCGWAYTFSVVLIVSFVDSTVLCDKTQWQVSSHANLHFLL